MEKFKTVICSLSAKYIHAALAPWCLYEGVKKYAPSVSTVVIEGTINENEDAVTERITAQKPDAVGFCCYIWNKEKVLYIAKRVKEALPFCKIILGGPEVSFNEERVLSENPFVDFIISGEGEKAFADTVTAISKNELPEKIASYFYEGSFVKGKYNIFEEELSPYGKEYFSSLKGRISYIESSRGCPYSCSFCLSGGEKKVRFFSMERVKREMLLLSQSGSQTVKFVDRTFNANKKRAVEILSFIKENYGKEIPFGICFHFEIAADILQEDMLFVISSMPKGSVQFEVGIQTFNELTLSKINRKTSLERLSENVKKLVSFGNCHIHTDLIAGLPFEDMSSFKESFNKAYALGANMLQLGFLKILHGSQMEKTTDEYVTSYSHKPPYEVTATPWMTAEELSSLHSTEDALERLHNSGRFKRTLSYVLTAAERKPFDLFEGFGIFAEGKNKKRPTLEEYTEWAYEYFSSLKGVKRDVLRDRMITDRIAVNSSGIIPQCLQVKDGRLKRVKYLLSLTHPTEKNIKRTVAILYTENAVLYCDYKEKDAVSGECELKTVDLSEFDEMKN